MDHLDGPRRPPPPAGADAALSTTSPGSSRTYLTLLANPQASREELVLLLGTDRASLDASLDELESHGSVLLHPDGSVHVPPPDIALPARAGQLEREALRIRAVADELAVIYHQARSTRAGDRQIEMLDHREDVLRSFRQLLGGARAQVRGLDRAPYAGMSEAPEVQRQQARDGVRFLSVYDVTHTRGPDPMAALAQLLAAGEQVRVLRGVPLKMVLADDDAALVMVRTEDDVWRGSMLVRRSPLLDSLILLFETLWRLAVPLPRAVDQAGAPLQMVDRPAARDLQVLGLLASGATDEAIARQLGLSTRTVERRVRAMLDRLGAETRFQAGVQATRRGWL